MRQVSVIVAAACLVLAPQARAAESAAASRAVNRAWSGIVGQYEADLKAQGVVGSSLVVTKGGKPLKAAYYGLAREAANGLPAQAVDADTLYHWASITKMFTAVALLQLRDRGLISLDDRIVDYLPEFKQVHNPYGKMSDITLRHLLTHSSGLRGGTFPWRGENDWAPLEPAKWAQVAAMMPYTAIEFEPGSKFSYSNPGTSALGRVIEEVTGDDIEVYITKNILMPLGMTRSYFDTTPYYLQSQRSHNYYRARGVLSDNGAEVETGATNGNGGLNGPASDLLKFAHFLLGVGDNGNYDAVLSRKTLEEMRQPLLEAADESLTRQRMGLSTFVIDEDVGAGKTLRFIGHTGGQVGFSSFVYVQPESDAAVVFVQNTRNADVARKDTVFARTRTAVMTQLFPLLKN